MKKQILTKKYERPEIQVIEFHVMDIIKTSGGEPFLGEDDSFN